MNIQLCDGPGRIIGYELIDGSRYGEFFTRDDGRVWYCFSGFDRFVNQDRSAFEQCVTAWQSYLVEVVQLETDRDQLDAVSRFRLQLRADRTCLEDPDSFWAIILEQAKQGML